MNTERSDGRRRVLAVDPVKVVRVLTCAAVLVVLAGVGTQCVKYLLGFDHMRGLVGLFDLDYERNVPALFSVCLLGAAFLLLATIALLEKQRRGPDVLPWSVLAVGFFLMSVDESWSFHEKLNQPVRALLGADGGMLLYAWVLPGMVLVAAWWRRSGASWRGWSLPRGTLSSLPAAFTWGVRSAWKCWADCTAPVLA
jgi:hypothetical protein